MLYHANRHLTLPVENNLNLTCLSRFRFCLIWLSALHHRCHAMHIISWSCRFFFVVVSYASLFVVAFCFFTDRTWVDASYNKFSGCSSSIFNSQTFLCRGILSILCCFSLMLALICVLVTCPIHLLPQATHIASTTLLQLLFGLSGLPCKS
jgi:hypothetical protein